MGHGSGDDKIKSGIGDDFEYIITINYPDQILILEPVLIYVSPRN
jgi:hypothetical protein